MRWIDKRPLPKYLLADQPGLDLAYRYWMDKRTGGLLPARADVDTPAFKLLCPEGLWIDTTAGQKEEWPLGPLAPFGGLKGRQSELTLGAMVRADLGMVAFTGTALFQAIRIAMADDNEYHLMMALPHANDGRRVSGILMICHQVTPVDMVTDLRIKTFN